MTRLRKSPGIKIITIALMGLFIIQTDILFSQADNTSPVVKETLEKVKETLDNQFEKAKSEYLSAGKKKSGQENNKIYENAGKRLKRLKTVFENLNIPDPPGDEFKEIKCRQGQTLLLLGACCEKLNNADEARLNYTLAKKILGKGFSLKGLKLKSFPVYKEIKRQKPEPGSKVIYGPCKPCWIKRNKLLLMAGGGLIAVILVI